MKWFRRKAEAHLRVTSPLGFHLRPAARFSTEAKRHACAIELCKEAQCADAKRLDALLALGVAAGDTLILRAKGKGATHAVASLQDTFETIMANEAATPAPKETQQGDEVVLSEGIAVGVPFAMPDYSHDNTPKRSFSEAYAMLLQQLGEEDDPVFKAQRALLQTFDSSLTLDAFASEIATRTQSLNQGAMEAKRDDYNDLLMRIRTLIYGEPTQSFPDDPFVLFAEGLLPSQAAALPPHTAGAVLSATSPASHTALILRAKHIPALGMRTLPPSLPKHPVVVDAQTPQLLLEPTQAQLQKAYRRIRDQADQEHLAYQARFKPALSARFGTVEVLANVGSIQEAKEAKEAGAEGIGLLRTEFLFDGDTPPSFETQRNAYEAIFAYFDNITVRTLDIGADKPVNYVDIPKEENPFLGMRGIRLLQRHPTLFETQLHAIFVASQGKPIRIMFPMIATPDEFDEAKAFALQTAQKHHLDISRVSFGMMVEIPSVLFAMEAFNRRVDFYSIGTNDLAQYLFAVARTHTHLHIDPASPILLEAVRTVIDKSDKPVSICGETGALPHATLPLLEAGLRTFSIAPSAVAQLKARIRHV